MLNTGNIAAPVSPGQARPHSLYLQFFTFPKLPDLLQLLTNSLSCLAWLGGWVVRGWYSEEDEELITILLELRQSDSQSQSSSIPQFFNCILFHLQITLEVLIFSTL